MRNAPHAFAVFIGLASLALVAAGCNISSTPATPTAPAASGVQAPGTPPGQSQLSPAAQKIKRGGTMTYAATSSMAGADPAMGQNSFQLWNYVGTYMLRRTPDTWKLEGDAIEKWDFSADGMELTLKVRQGVKWQNKPPVNGRDVEARDIVYTLKSITGQQYPDLPPLRFPRKAQLDDMADAVAVDKYTVKVKMTNPTSTFLDGLAEYRSPLTPDQVREALGGRESLTNPSPDAYLSAGPFLLTQFKDSVDATYTRYPDYWEKGEDGQSKPYLDSIRVLWIPEVGTQNAAYIAGQLSYHSIANPETRDRIVNARKDAQIFTYSPSSCWTRLAFNTTFKPFSDVRVRKALALVLDPVETGETLYGEFQGKPVWRYPGPLPWSFPEAIPQEELAKMPYYEHPKSQKTLDEAKRLMAEAGYSEGFAFEMISPNSSGSRDQQALYTAQINRVFPNIKIKNSPIDGALQLERAAAGNFEAQAYCYIHEPTAVAMMKTPYHSKGGRNVARWSDPKMDDLLDRAGRELDATKRTALLRQAQMMVLENFSIMPTTHMAAQIAFQPEFRGMRLGGGTIGYGMYAKDIWIDK